MSVLITTKVTELPFFHVTKNISNFIVTHFYQSNYESRILGWEPRARDSHHFFSCSKRHFIVL